MLNIFYYVVIYGWEIIVWQFVQFNLYVEFKFNVLLNEIDLVGVLFLWYVLVFKCWKLVKFYFFVGVSVFL